MPNSETTWPGNVTSTVSFFPSTLNDCSIVMGPSNFFTPAGPTGGAAFSLTRRGEAVPYKAVRSRRPEFDPARSTHTPSCNDSRPAPRVRAREAFILKTAITVLVLFLSLAPLAPAVSVARNADLPDGLAPANAHPIGPLSGGPCLLGGAAGGAIFEEDFEDSSAGWTLVSTPGRPNLWHWTEFAGNGTANDALGHDGPGRMYYGIENRFGGTYNTSRMRNQGEARSPAIEIPNDGHRYAITLATKWHVELDRAWLIDSMMMGFTPAGGTRSLLCYFGNVYGAYWNIPMGYGYYQTSPWGNAALTGCEYALETPHNPCRFSEDALGIETAFDLAPDIALWEERSVLLPAPLAGRTIHLSFYFQTGDAIVDDAMGWMIDDVRVVRVD